ncbi:MAG: HypC/HybG/HupF family hydrogenase formation chaperone [Sulfuricaulis sp.]|jgi:hydrogenase expression/formation protein HypC|uniref:HypC/HybG/HupF family hydrogenase formation chaperone n=1 Tax=Sulfuricaulis sp. TaxID=2003553 RepID=UPI0025EFA5E0|nr:HypC/HybG/HupF family hydrogenase formation chaperone [Sulfuricaulis sp.]MCR4347227.1 HypC/HybG/HupF family hydrogenase formation chaperone [Sulfuricaulis sp.]
MCLAIPAKVVQKLDNDCAEVEVGGVRNTISLMLVDDVAVGDYVIVHVGFAITRLNAEEAEKTLELFDQIARHLDARPYEVHQ